MNHKKPKNQPENQPLMNSPIYETPLMEPHLNQPNETSKRVALQQLTKSVLVNNYKFDQRLT